MIKNNRIGDCCTVIAIANQKGGVGKTTTVANLAAALTEKDNKVLVIDCDSQANLTMSLGVIQPDELEDTVTTVMQQVIDDVASAREYDFENNNAIISCGKIDLLPASITLAGMELVLANTIARERILKEFVDQARKVYDYILIDCMPSLGLITINALAAADGVIIPTNPSYLSTAGLEQLCRSINMIRRQINPGLEIYGILLTMVQQRTLLARNIIELISERFGKEIHVYNTMISHSVKAAEAQATGVNILDYDNGCKTAREYMALADEVMGGRRYV